MRYLKTLLIVLFCFAACFGAYAPPTEDTIHFVYSTGDATPGGGFALADAANFVDAEGKIDLDLAMGTNGTYIATGAAKAVTTGAGGTSIIITDTGAFSTTTAGLLVYCDFDATYDDGVYVIDAVTANTIQLPITYSADTTVEYTAGGAFAAISTALADSSTVCATGAEFYNRTILSNESETLGASLDFATGGDVEWSVYRTLAHFNTDTYVIDNVISSDEDVGFSKHIMTTDRNAYGAMAMFRNDELSVTVNGDYYGEIDADDAAIDVITLGGACIEIRNFKIHNTDEASGNNIFTAGAARKGIVLQNCWLDDAYDICADHFDKSFVISCYTGDDFDAGKEINGHRLTMIGCVGNGKGLNYALGDLNDYGVYINCFGYKGDYGVFPGQGGTVTSCIFYGQTTGCFRSNSATHTAYIQNNIFCPAVGASDYAIVSAAGSFLGSNNLVYAVDGALTTPFYNSTASAEIFLPGTIEVNPLFIDPSTGDFRLRHSSPALKAGITDFFGKPSNIGVDHQRPKSSGGRLGGGSRGGSRLFD